MATTSETYKRAAQVARHVQLSDVYLVAIEARMHREQREILAVPNWKIDISKRACGSHKRGETPILVVETDFDVTVSDTEPGSTLLFGLTCRFALEYFFKADGAPEGDDFAPYLQAFATINGVYNAWPYFRELTHTTVARMGLPPLVVPVYRVNDELEKQRESEEALP